MLPIGPLMQEHRLIERMVSLFSRELDTFEKTGLIHWNFIGAAVDFYVTYADQCHHGKEEEILFRDLERKPLTAGHSAMLKELLADHVKDRELVRTLSNARKNSDLAAAQDCLQKLATLYTSHIEKEDKRFFIPAIEYLSPQEQARMLDEFQAFDLNFIHDKYQRIVRRFETGESEYES